MLRSPTVPLVRLLRGWEWADLRQTPGGAGIWDGIQFTTEEVDDCDYVVVESHTQQPVRVHCPPENVWLVAMEPPNEDHRQDCQGREPYARIFMHERAYEASHRICGQCALPWHVGRSYDDLISLSPPVKTKTLSWITSDKSFWRGHRLRMNFLEKLRQQMSFDLFGRGFTPLADKWDGLADYKHSLAIENFANPVYFTEKLVDCFLTWTLPFYWGCTNIGAFFPPQAVVPIDITRPRRAIRIIQETLQADIWRERLPYLKEARQLALDRYQLFPFLATQIHADLACRGARPRRRQWITVCR